MSELQLGSSSENGSYTARLPAQGFDGALAVIATSAEDDRFAEFSQEDGQTCEWMRQDAENVRRHLTCSCIVELHQDTMDLQG